MDAGHPYRTICSGMEGPVLDVLARTTRPLTGRDIARLSNSGSRPSLMRAVRHLVAEGVVLAEPAGNALLFTLNRDHLAAPVVEQLVNLRAHLVDRMRNAVVGWDIRPAFVAMFGSMARGDGSPSSDIDLFIVRPDACDEHEPGWRAQIHDLGGDVYRWTGNHASTIEVSTGDFRAMEAEGANVLESVKRDGIILNVGPDKPLGLVS